MPDALAISPEEARAIAKDAYIYGFPLADSCRIPIHLPAWSGDAAPV